MSQRNSEYTRIAGDTYITPPWVYAALYAVEPWAVLAIDCAPANGKYDFLSDWDWEGRDIASNPPYGRLAERFVRHALNLPGQRNIAFLLPSVWDCAKLRVDLFEDRRFVYKYILTRRILWENLEHANAPSTNHAWFVWHEEPRETAYPMIRWLKREAPPVGGGAPLASGTCSGGIGPPAELNATLLLSGGT